MHFWNSSPPFPSLTPWNSQIALWKPDFCTLNWLKITQLICPQLSNRFLSSKSPYAWEKLPKLSVKSTGHRYVCGLIRYFSLFGLIDLTPIRSIVVSIVAMKKCITNRWKISNSSIARMYTKVYKKEKKMAVLGVINLLKICRLVDWSWDVKRGCRVSNFFAQAELINLPSFVA